MRNFQSGILAPVPSYARYVEFGGMPGQDPVPVLRKLASQPIDQTLVVGIGPGLIQGLGCSVEGFRTFPSLSGPGCEVPRLRLISGAGLGATIVD